MGFWRRKYREEDLAAAKVVQVVAHPQLPSVTFDSDAHRRVLGLMPLPGEEPFDLSARVAADPYTNLGDRTLEEIVNELSDEGYASHGVMTVDGLNALRAPEQEN